MIIFMIIGVMGFYFVLSNINSVVSSTVRMDIEFAARLSMLEKIKKKYQLSLPVYKETKRSLFEDEFKSMDFNLNNFFKKFPISLREDLKYHLNVKKLAQFNLFYGLDRSTLNTLGDSLKLLRFEPSKSFNTKTLSYMSMITPPRTYISSNRGRP